MLDKTSFPYGAGFRSLTREIAEPVSLPVRGELPSWLKGSLLRTGPSKFEVGARTYNHWFDGLAMLHRFAFGRGGVSYTNRFLKSKAFCAAEATGKISYAEFATDPCRTLFGRVAAIFDPKLTDNCCVNVSGYADSIVAFTETAIPMRFQPETLETLGVFGYAPSPILITTRRANAITATWSSSALTAATACSAWPPTARNSRSPSFPSTAPLICTVSP